MTELRIDRKSHILLTIKSICWQELYSAGIISQVFGLTFESNFRYNCGNEPGEVWLGEDNSIQFHNKIFIGKEAMIGIKVSYITTAFVVILLYIPAGVAHGFELFGIHQDTGDLWKISTVDASLTPAAQLGVTPMGSLELAPDGDLYGFTVGLAPVPTLYRIDSQTYDVSAVGPLGLDFVFEGGLAFGSAGEAYAVNSKASENPKLFSIDLNTGQGTEIGIISGGSHDFNGLAWRSDGMLVGIDSVTNALLSIDPSNATSVEIAILDPILGAVGGMAAIGDTAYFVTAGPGIDTFFGTNSLYSVDLFTGDTLFIGSFDGTIDGKGFSGLAIPEPATLLLLLVGAGVSLRRRN